MITAGVLALPRAGWGADGVRAALSEAAHAGLFGVALGWVPALAALAVTLGGPAARPSPR